MLNFIGGIVVCKVGYDVLKKAGVLDKSESKEGSAYFQTGIKYEEEEIKKVEKGYKQKIKEAIKEGDTEKVFKLQSEMNELLSQMKKENESKISNTIKEGADTIGRFANGFMKGLKEGIEQAKNGGDN